MIEREIQHNIRSQKKSKIFMVLLGSELERLGRMGEEKTWHRELFNDVISMQWQLKANRVPIKNKKK